MATCSRFCLMCSSSDMAVIMELLFCALSALAIARGVGSLNRGLMMRGVEELSPAAICNPLRALRYQVEEGARTRGGEKQIEVTTFEKLGKALGFTPRRVAEMYEGVSAVRNRQHGIELRRGELLDQFAAAVRERDLPGLGRRCGRFRDSTR